MVDAITPQRRVDTRVQLWTPVYAIVHDVTGRRQDRASATIVQIMNWRRKTDLCGAVGDDEYISSSESCVAMEHT